MDGWVVATFGIGGVMIGIFLGDHSVRSEYESKLKECAKANNVFECEWVATPKQSAERGESKGE